MVNEGLIWYSAHTSPIVPPPLSIYLTVFIAFNINNIIVIIDLQQVFYCKIEESSSSSPNKEWQNCRNHCSHHHDHHHHQNIEMSTWQRWAPRVGLSGDFNEDDARSMAKKENWNEENDLCKSKTLIKRIMMKIAHDYEHNDHAGILVQFNLNWLPLQVGSPNLATPCLCSRTTTDSMRYYWAIIIIIKVVSRVFLPFFLC